MKILKLENSTDSKVIVLGRFSTLHIGHQKLIAKANEISDNITLMRIMSKKRIFTNSEIDYLSDIKNWNIKNILDLDFNQIKDLDKYQFINKLKLMGFEKIICGSDFMFGNERKGNIDDLKKYFEVHVIDIEYIDGNKISTSEIINDLESSNMNSFYKKHNFNYFVYGEVIDGDKIGRTISFPTTNQDISNKIIPKYGSYSSNVIYNNKKYLSATYLGVRPSVSGISLRFETNIFDFNDTIYGEKIVVELLHHDRGEMKFNSLDELKSQIKKDVENAKRR